MLGRDFLCFHKEERPRSSQGLRSVRLGVDCLVLKNILFVDKQFVKFKLEIRIEIVDFSKSLNRLNALHSTFQRISPTEYAEGTEPFWQKAPCKAAYVYALRSQTKRDRGSTGAGLKNVLLVGVELQAKDLVTGMA